MSKILLEFASLIANDLRAPKRDIQDCRIIGSYVYSSELFEKMAETLLPLIIEELKNSEVKIGIDEFDTIFICGFKLTGKDYSAIIYDYAELYYPTFVWKIMAA